MQQIKNFWINLSEQKKILLIMFLVGVVAVLVSSNILDSFFTGEDEAHFLRLANDVFQKLQRGDFHTVYLLLLYHDHPPFPILLGSAFIPIVGYREAALRLPNVILWAICCMSVAKVGQRVGGWKVGLLSGLFLAISGTFDLEAMGDGKSLEALSVLLMINVLLDNFEWNLDTPQTRKKYILGGVYLAIGYFFFTSTLPTIGMYHLVFLIILLRERPSWHVFWQYVLYTLPFVLFYLIYNAIFLGIPAYDYYVLGAQPYGQFAQNLMRAGTTGLNVESLLVNLKVMNWYVLPFVSWLILAAGIYLQIKKYPRIFWITMEYGAFWSFYMVLNTGHHFLAYFCCMVPFGITAIDQLLQKWKKVPTVTWATVLTLTFAWNYWTHIKIYSYDDYPRYLQPLVYGQGTGWINNIYRPLRKIANELDKELGPNTTVISLIDGALSIYYYPKEQRYAPISTSDFEIRQDASGKCLSLDSAILKQYKIRAIVSYTDQNICSDIVERVVKYPGSNIQLTFVYR